MNEYHKPDAAEKCIRFGCGFVFGGLIAFFTALGYWGLAMSPSFLAIAVIALVFGFLAMHFGDRFWHAREEYGFWDFIIWFFPPWW